MTRETETGSDPCSIASPLLALFLFFFIFLKLKSISCDQLVILYAKNSFKFHDS